MDLVVAFFAILLVLFVVYSLQAQSETSDDSRYTYRPQDERIQPFRLRSFAAIYPFRAIWIVRNGNLYHLSMAQIARRYLQTDENILEYMDSSVYLRLKPQTGAGLFKLQILFFGKDIPAWMLHGDPIPLPSIKEQGENAAWRALLARLSQSGNILFFVFDGENQRVSGLFEALQDAGIPFDVRLLKKRRKAITIARKVEFYDFLDAILRPY